MGTTKTPCQTWDNAKLLRRQVDHANNLPYGGNAEEYYKFFVFDYAHHVGLIRPKFMADNVQWPKENFEVDRKGRTVRLNPDIEGRGYEKACRDSMIDFCEKNKGTFQKAFVPWLKRPDRDTSDPVSQRVLTEAKDYHGIIGLKGDLECLCSATPARGIFGLATAGVHVNAYEATVDEKGNEIIAKVWLSVRRSDQTFPNSFDQIAAGAIDGKDRMNRLIALKRELESETQFKLATDNKTVLDHVGQTCGELFHREHVVSIATLKGEIAGPKECGHLEFAIRFAYDLRLKPGCQPLPGEDTQFRSVDVKNLAKEGFEVPWKYSSGAVFFDFILRHKLMSVDEATRKELWEKLHRDVPFANAQQYLNCSRADT